MSKIPPKSSVERSARKKALPLTEPGKNENGQTASLRTLHLSKVSTNDVKEPQPLDWMVYLAQRRRKITQQALSAQRGDALAIPVALGSLRIYEHPLVLPQFTHA